MRGITHERDERLDDERPIDARVGNYLDHSPDGDAYSQQKNKKVH
jgi:hypothetical protein